MLTGAQRDGQFSPRDKRASPIKRVGRVWMRERDVKSFSRGGVIAFKVAQD